LQNDELCFCVKASQSLHKSTFSVSLSLVVISAHADFALLAMHL